MREIFGQINWRNHTLTLIQLALSLVLLIVSYYYYYENQDKLRLASATYDAQRFQTDSSESLEAVLRTNIDHYRDLVADGFVGSPRRLQWLETLRQLGSNYDIPGIEFTLERSEPAEQNVDAFWHPEVRLMTTNMNMVLEMTHEGDLFRLLNGLRSHAVGLFSVENCRLRWLDTYSEEYELSRFRGGCKLRWYTLVDGTKISQGI